MVNILKSLGNSMVVKLGDIKLTKTRLYWSKRHDGLKESVTKNYNSDNGLLISKDMKLIDGHHRYHFLIEEYGNDYEIKVKQSKFNFIHVKIFGLVFLPIVVLSLFILLPIITIIHGIKLIFNYLNKND